MQLSDKDREHLERMGIDKISFEKQLRLFQDGVPKLNLLRPATSALGIHTLDPTEKIRLTHTFDQASVSLGRFIPASGAASRMFKSLVQNYEIGQYDEQSKLLFEKRELLPYSVKEIGKIEEFFKLLLDSLKLQDQPKGLLNFHRYARQNHTALEDQLLGWKSVIGDRQSTIHFTVSPEHREAFLQSCAETIRTYGWSNLKTTFSVQDPATDTISLDGEGSVFRHTEGTILLRPAGHGALLGNLNSMEEDMVYISNIDNIAHADHHASAFADKKVLAGLLLQIRDVVHRALLSLENDEPINLDDLNYLQHWLWMDKSLDKANMHAWLNRPIRVCGMVPNTGEPGGGPFWVEHKGRRTLQIVEGAQINKKDPQQMDYLQSSTHFNPVDMVVSFRDHHGHKMEFSSFREDGWCILTDKTFDGKPLKALELPGLWNGGMADWITVFVEVSLDTFHPVKTFHDLLNWGHQPVEQ